MLLRTTLSIYYRRSQQGTGNVAFGQGARHVGFAAEIATCGYQLLCVAIWPAIRIGQTKPPIVASDFPLLRQSSRSAFQEIAFGSAQAGRIEARSLRHGMM